jgi:hypothetical protein
MIDAAPEASSDNLDLVRRCVRTRREGVCLVMGDTAGDWKDNVVDGRRSLRGVEMELVNETVDVND